MFHGPNLLASGLGTLNQGNRFEIGKNNSEISYRYCRYLVVVDVVVLVRFR